MSEGRRYNVVANIRLSKEQKQWLTREAKRNGCSISEVVRESVEKMKQN